MGGEKWGYNSRGFSLLAKYFGFGITDGIPCTCEDSSSAIDWLQRFVTEGDGKGCVFEHFPNVPSGLKALKRELHIMMYEKRSMTFLEDETDMDVAWSMWEKGLMRIMEECIPPRYKH